MNIEGRRSKPPNSLFDDFEISLQMTRTMKAAHVYPTLRLILPFFMIEKPPSMKVQNLLSPTANAKPSISIKLH